ncbi:Oar protein [Acidisarcina polymorpha]|uniref:Oar protein n=2 Tax=Acidisarcina polymorpha TaxID=2211140 RepID=A0A2Z5FXK6_9BACT|nr:Oar protein [Acidisarcina polymorpha]
MLLGFALSSTAIAQVNTGQIEGTVTDPSGALVANATVTVKNLGTDATRVEHSSVNGTYLLSDLSPANYELTITAENFKSFVSRVTVTVGGHTTIDAKLTLGQGTTEVEVVGEGGAQVNTQTQELSQVVDQQQISQLPSLTRNPYDFVALSGNISGGDNSAAGNSQNATLRGVNFNINGQRSTGTEILLDGVENITVFGDGVGIKVPIDGVQEFRIVTSNFEPQYGRASGGVVNVTTKAGTNAFHGSAWEFNRLAAYTSNTVTNSQEGIPKGQYTRNQFGFAVGGPILKDKLFFFGSTEWTRVRSAAVSTAAVPTPQYLAVAPANIQAYFAAYGANTFNLNTTYSAADLGIATLPAATPVLGTTTFTAPGDAGGGLPQNTYNILGRFDYNLSDKTQVFFRYVDYNEADQAGSVFSSPYSQYNVSQTVQNQAYLLSASHVFNPSLVSNTKLSFSRFNTAYAYDTALQNTPTLIVSPNAQIPGTSTFIQLPGFYDTNPANGGLPYGGPQNTVQINHDLDVIKGKHSMQYGAQILYIQDNNAYGAYAQANEQLGQGLTKGLAALGTGNLFEFEAAVNPAGALPCVRDPYTGDLTQTPGCSINLPASAPSFARSERFHDWAVYGQDAWKVSPRFTFNYGVRYEYYGVQHNNHKDLDSNFYYGDGNLDPEGIRTGQVFTTPTSPIHSLWNPSYGTVSPRIGFAYDIFGDGKTSVRGGYGISYERNFGNVTFNVIQNPPNYAVIIINGTPVTNSNAGPLAGASGSVPLPPTSLRNVDQNIKTAQTQFYSAALEHQFGAGTVLSLEYAGARGLHLYDIKNVNGLGSGNALLGDSLLDPSGTIPALTRLNSQYSNTNNRGSGADSYYHAMNIQFQSSNLHRTGLTLVANYTLSHATDDLSTTFSETNNEFSLGYTNPFNPALDHGTSDLDIRHRLVIAPIYRTPWFANGHSALKQALFGWQITGIYQVRTGTPFSYYDTTFNNTGYNVARYTPDGGVVPKHTFKSIPSGVNGGGTNAYNVGNLPASFSFLNQAWYDATNTPAVNAAGNEPLTVSDWGPYPAAMTSRNAFRGPGAWNVDAAVSKTFPIHEQVNLVFRAEGFDILNHHNLYIQQGLNDVANVQDFTQPLSVQQRPGVPLPITASKGGIGADGGVNDERRFGQFSLSLQF